MVQHRIARASFAGIYVWAWIGALIGFSIWFGVTGKFSEPIQQLYTFWATGGIKHQDLAWGAWKLVAGFALLILWVSVGIALISLLVGKRMPQMSPGYERLFNLSLYSFGNRLLGTVFVEELLYRWFPIAIVFSLFSTDAMLKIIVVITSFAFAARHISNVRFEKRLIPFFLAQFFAGTILSYVFLALEFSGALTVHLVFDLPLVALEYGARKISPNLPSIIQEKVGLAL